MMEKTLLTHELATFLLGAGSCALVRAYVPLEAPIKSGVLCVIAGATVLRMVFLAGLL